MTRFAMWALALAAAAALGLYAQPELPPGVPAGARLLPRIQPVPTDTAALLSQLGVGSTFWYVAIVMLPVLVWGARRLDTDQRRVRALVIALASLAGLIMLTAAIDFVMVFGNSPYRPRVVPAIVAQARQNTLPWLAVTGVVLALESRRRAIRSSLERERFRAEVAEQRVIALTNQLQPHFLFNTLQGISTLIHRDPAAADEMLTKLSDLLRDLLRHRDRVLVTLGEELQYAQTYLEIAKIRFADRLSFEITADPSLRDVSVPLFLLQPLVENALKHGIGARIGGGRITITVVRDGDRVRIDVADDGPNHPISSGNGIGLSNTRERLSASFGLNQSFSLLPREGGGALARLDIPYVPSAAAQ